jgi:signal transduction histidine kinase
MNFGEKMKRKLSALSGRYRAALRKHLKAGPRAGLETARGLGRQAMAIGLETLDMARIHGRALAMLEAGSSKDGFLRRAGIFFTEAIAPIEETHRTSVQATARLKRLSKRLNRRTVELAGSTGALTKAIARRKDAEAALKKTNGHYLALLQESLALQKHLRQLAHRILSAQEHKRTKVSHNLQDEVAQTLLGINVRLLTMKEAAGQNAQKLQEEIACTRRLVDMSVKTIERFTREYGEDHDL